MKYFLWPSEPWWLLWMLSTMLSCLEACPVMCNCLRANTLVNCSGRGLTEVPSGIPGRVVVLFLQNNNIESLTQHSGLRALVNLTRLNLNHNKLRHISGTPFPAALNTLALDNNSLTVITTGMFSLTKIVSIRLVHNRISRIEDNAFPPTLRYLDLHHNRMRVVNRTTFSSYTTLHTLCLTYNRIHKIENMAFPSSLRMLRLGFNRLKKINQEFSNLRDLKTLFLYYNTIAKINKASFSGLVGLVELNLMKNRLTVVHPEQFAKQVNLQSLNLFDNLIHTLPESAFPLKHALERLYLQGNPLRCDCKMKWVARMINGSSLNTRMYRRFFYDQEILERDWPPLPGPDTIFCSTPTPFTATPITLIDFDFCNDIVDTGPISPRTLPPVWRYDDGEADTPAATEHRTSPSARAETALHGSSTASSVQPTVAFTGAALSLAAILLR